MADDFLSVRGLTLHYGGSQILNGIDLSAVRGEVTCITGTNGVGKTSLLKALSGTHPRSDGDYVLDGQPIGRLKAFDLARRGVAYVPQGREIFPFLTVRENLETGFACLPKSKRQVNDEIFELFPILKTFLNRRGGDLSGGQQQQLAIARALVSDPKVLLLDEPTEGIQPNVIQQIAQTIRILKARGTIAIILVEQFLSFAHDLGDTFIVMERGKVKLRGRKSSLSIEDLVASTAL
ncbi:urea ABC transporter ATP-binding subunit UrtE [Maribius pontilimi]|uniref:Urea ABC transporter ATP-binding subunit UrtE n=1 Tax=Palleronia pontilimi TaxID=1964209 RepID=A0A934MHZ9_9RHOB|nr:urea ABC transporter ATP-binding subunit UrtE [Palleronia pontilimi]MBJ3763789.1 urea ABC transporter ATP-binding subunit UrtE [Palleronia pontilimi]